MVRLEQEAGRWKGWGGGGRRRRTQKLFGIKQNQLRARERIVCFRSVVVCVCVCVPERRGLEWELGQEEGGEGEHPLTVLSASY